MIWLCAAGVAAKPCSAVRYSQKTWTYPFENRKNIYRFAVSPDGLTAITVDEGVYVYRVAAQPELYRVIAASHTRRWQGSTSQPVPQGSSPSFQFQGTCL